MRRLVPALLALVPAVAFAQSPSPAAAPGVGATLDLVGDLSERQPLGPDSARLAVRGFELAVHGSPGGGWQAAAYGILRDRGGAELLEAFAARTVRGAARVAVGRTLVAGPLGNTVHLHALPGIERPLSQRLLLDADGVGGSGVVLGLHRGVGPVRLAADAGVSQRFLDDSASLRPLERPDRLVSGLGYAGRVTATTGLLGAQLGVAAFGLTSRRVQPLSASAPFNGVRVNAIVARQSLIGGAWIVRSGAADAPAPDASSAATASIDRWVSVHDTARWSAGVEAMVQVNEREADVAGRIPGDPATGGPTYRGPTRDFAAVAAHARARVWRGVDATLRFDFVEDPANAGSDATAAGATVGWRWTERGRVAAGVEALSRANAAQAWRILVQAAFTMGSHEAMP